MTIVVILLHHYSFVRSKRLIQPKIIIVGLRVDLVKISEKLNNLEFLASIRAIGVYRGWCIFI